MKWLGLGLLVALACIGSYLFASRNTPYAWNPACTYQVAYRLTAQIDVSGQKYRSDVTRIIPISRAWLRWAIPNGCEQTHGTALSFRLSDNSLVLLPTQICQNAMRALSGRAYDGDFTRAMAEHQAVDVAASCNGIANGPSYAGDSRPDGFVIYDADNPTKWRSFKFRRNDLNIHLDAAVAEAGDFFPSDDLDKIAPNALRAVYLGDVWSSSPEPFLNYSRRTQRGPFAYKVVEIAQ